MSITEDKTYWHVSFYWEDRNEEAAEGFGNMAFAFTSSVLPLGKTIREIKKELGVSDVTIINFREIRQEQYEEFKKYLQKSTTI